MEKDERFWVAAALMQLFHAPDRIELFARLLRHCLGDTPPGSLLSWEAALGDEQFLYFEANLPSPAGYSDRLGRRLDERVLVPYLREAAGRSRQRGRKLEGASNVDALLTVPATGFAVLFEAKVLADISAACSSTSCATRSRATSTSCSSPPPNCGRRCPSDAQTGRASSSSRPRSSAATPRAGCTGGCCPPIGKTRPCCNAISRTESQPSSRPCPSAWAGSPGRTATACTPAPAPGFPHSKPEPDQAYANARDPVAFLLPAHRGACSRT
jgi:hypothetical protein